MSDQYDILDAEITWTNALFEFWGAEALLFAESQRVLMLQWNDRADILWDELTFQVPTSGRIVEVTLYAMGHRLNIELPDLTGSSIYKHDEIDLRYHHIVSSDS